MKRKVLLQVLAVLLCLLMFTVPRVMAQSEPCTADFDCNGNVDANDVTTFLSQFGRNPFNDPCPDCYDSSCPCQQPEQCPSPPFIWCTSSLDCASGSGNCCCCFNIIATLYGFCLDVFACEDHPSGFYYCQ